MTCTPRIPAEFLGWTQSQLQAEFTSLQQAIGQMTSGARPASVSYTQGPNGRTVSFNRADLGAMQQRLQVLAGILYPGQGYGRRRPLRPVYR